MTEVSHWGAVIPILLLLVSPRSWPREYWIMAIAYAMSWFADGGMDTTRDSSGWHVFIGAQMVLFALATGAPAVRTLLATVAIAAATAFGPFLSLSPLGPYTVVAVVSMPAVYWLAREWESPLRSATYVYVVIGGMMSMPMFLLFDGPRGQFMAAWYLYQVARFASFGLFIHHAYKWREA